MVQNANTAAPDGDPRKPRYVSHVRGCLSVSGGHSMVPSSPLNSGEVVDVVLGQVRGVPRDRAVVGVVMQDRQAVMGSGRGDDEVHR